MIKMIFDHDFHQISTSRISCLFKLQTHQIAGVKEAADKIPKYLQEEKYKRTVKTKGIYKDTDVICTHRIQTQVGVEHKLVTFMMSHVAVAF
jgi:hypothetical protein